MSPSPIYTPQDTPFFKSHRNRLTKTRTKQLLRAAKRTYNDPPPPPGLGECCGSSCDPCVTDLWKEELAVWRERWGEGAVEGGSNLSLSVSSEDKEGGEEKDGKDRVVGCVKEKMPGGWEW
ncbi:hypothetical protein BO94DRAFT_67642 [Aspergillus sclerotioniger CBS 115572]|uniref:Oxidoreductase-like domain-containing protein n=1 Tax=Aspergillus sclerotioniger CBS 115572 TaxID=1450535 RepID=A0A317WKU9_9EURO|nr:hypothetical protein BO94DRAFT_67642 [Aspergillus sclerotioniger CBS 115572]PWY87126.1 hypothetical protein BO94DRAFT_67642 [Aspergillus sclerotioniger CBS 115572]